MKKIYYLVSALVVATFIGFIYSCETDPDESCNKDEICTDKFVTVCCTDDECVYKYDGKEYADTEESRDALAIEMGCSVSTLKSYKQDLNAIKIRLQDLMNRTKAGK